jgi:hypothetical protein
MRKIVLTFGVISGLIMSAMFVLTIPFKDQIGFDRGMIIGYASMLAASLLIYFGIRSYRDNVARGPIGFGRAFTVGILIVLVANTLYVATWEIVWPRYLPDFYEKYEAHQVASATAKGATPAEIESIHKYIVMFQNPVINALATFTEPLPVGLLVTLVSSWALSRRRRPESVAVPAT